MSAIKHRITALCFDEVPVLPLIAFRIIFGALMFFGTARFMIYGWVNDLYILPSFHFTYLGFDWIKPLPGDWMHLPFILMLLSSLGILLGYRYRLSSILFFLSFTYVELIDKTNYLNHYYLVSLLAFLLCWLPANVHFSLDVKRKPELLRTMVPGWTIALLKVQIGMVYCFAGIAKLQSDWLIEAQPLGTWLQAYRDLPYIGNWFASSWLAYLFSWFGCFYDLTIPFFLLGRKTRPVAYAFVVVFHITTWLLFPIGLFPWVMICSTLIFFPASFHKKWLSRLKKVFRSRDREPQTKTKARRGRKVTLILLSAYLVIQLFVPFRYLLYPGELFWNEEGFRFSWRVMLIHKEGYATFYVINKKTDRSIEINNTDYLTPNQIDQMSTQPDMILQFAHHLGEQFHDTILTYGEHRIHLRDPKIGADVFVSLNGRPNQQMIDRSTDLMKEEYSLRHREWVIRYKER